MRKNATIPFERQRALLRFSVVTTLARFAAGQQTVFHEDFEQGLNGWESQPFGKWNLVAEHQACGDPDSRQLHGEHEPKRLTMTVDALHSGDFLSLTVALPRPLSRPPGFPRRR